jgi:hypothetical protein
MSESGRFAQADVHDFAQSLRDALLTRIKAGVSPEKVADNNYSMKCKFGVSFTCSSELELVLLSDSILHASNFVLLVLLSNPFHFPCGPI